MKKILLFIVLEIILAGLLVGGLFLYHESLVANSQVGKSVTIKIKRGNSMNNTLTLEPANTVNVFNGSVVTWIIDPILTSNVDSFRIEKKENSPEIFRNDHLPPRTHAQRASGTVDNLSERIYNYNIFWRKRGDPKSMKERRFDPKLALIPVKDSPTKDLWIWLGYGLLALLPFGLFLPKKHRDTDER